MKDLRERVQVFRTSIVELVQAGSLPNFSTFPRGCCNDSAYLLGTYLSHKSFGKFEAVGAKSSAEGNDATHSWLEQDGLVIDITGSQFEESMLDVYIGHSPEWRGNWVVEQRFNAQVFNERLALGNIYNKIVANIK